MGVDWGGQSAEEQVGELKEQLKAERLRSERLERALEWFVGECDRATLKGYDLTEIILERCLKNAKETLSGKDGQP